MSLKAVHESFGKTSIYGDLPKDSWTALDHVTMLRSKVPHSGASGRASRLWSALKAPGVPSSVTNRFPDAGQRLDSHTLLDYDVQKEPALHLVSWNVDLHQDVSLNIHTRMGAEQTLIVLTWPCGEDHYT